MTFDVEFEDDVLGQCFRDDAFVKSVVRICDAHHFGTKEHAWIWKVISETWAKFRERATGRIIVNRAMDEFKDEEKRKPYLVLAQRLLKTKPRAPKAALENLSKFVRTVNVQLALEASATALEKGDLEKAEGELDKVRRTAVKERNYTHISWIEGFEDRQEARRYEREHPEEFTVIPTGIKRLDKALAGGARKGETCLIMGTTGRGKSILMENFCHAAIKHDFPTVYFALEMPAKQIAMRHDALWARMRYEQFKLYDFKPSELRELDVKLKRAMKRFKNKFHIISMPVKSADIRTLRAALDDLREEHGFTAAMLAVDSGDHMKHVDKALDSYRLQQAEVYWSLKQLAEEDGYVLWSTVHAGREWAHQIATSEATSESYDKARIADLILSINDPNARPERRRKTVISDDDDDDDEEPEVKGFEGESKRRHLEMYLAKYRDGVSKLKIDLDADLERMLIKAAEDDEEEADA